MLVHVWPRRVVDGDTLVVTLPFHVCGTTGDALALAAFAADPRYSTGRPSVAAPGTAPVVGPVAGPVAGPDAERNAGPDAGPGAAGGSDLTIRLRGVDTPERGEALYREATAFTRAALRHGAFLSSVGEGVAWASRRRVVAVVHVWPLEPRSGARYGATPGAPEPNPPGSGPRLVDEPVSLNEMLVRAGLARRLPEFDPDGLYAAAEAAARCARLGIWSTTSF